MGWNVCTSADGLSRAIIEVEALSAGETVDFSTKEKDAESDTGASLDNIPLAVFIPTWPSPA